MAPQMAAVPHNTRLQHKKTPTLFWGKKLTKARFITRVRIPADELWKPVPDPDEGVGKQPV